MPFTEITDPEEVAQIEALSKAKQGKAASTGTVQEITDPAEIARIEALAKQPNQAPKTELLTTSEEESWLPDVLKPVSKGLGLVRETLIGEPLAKAPSLLSGDKRTGAQTARELSAERRGMIPEYRQVEGSTQGAVQIAANIASGAVGLVGSQYSLPLEAGVLLARRHGQMAGGLATDVATAAYRAGLEAPAKAMFGEIAAKALARQQTQGDYATVKAAKEAAGGTAEFIKGAAFGMNPAIFEAARVLSEEGSAGDAFDAGVEALKAYPLESTLLGWHGLKKAGEVGGAPIVREGVPVQTIAGKPIKVNKLGEAIFEPATTLSNASPTKVAEAVAQKVENVAGQKAAAPFRLAERGVAKTVKAVEPIIGDTVKDVLEWGKETVEPKWQRLTYDAVTPKDLARQEGITAANKILMEGESPSSKKMKIALDQYDVLRNLQTELADPKFKAATELEKFQAIEGTLGDTVQMMEVPVMDQNSRAIADQLGNLFVQHGMPIELAQKAVPFTVLEGVRLAKQGKLTDPLVALHESVANLGQKTPVEAQAAVKALGAIVQAKMRDPNFIAAADQAWAGKGYRWVPGAEVRQRNGYMDAVRKVQEAAQQSGKPLFELSIPELGELRKDYTYQLYDKLVSDLDSTEQGRVQLMQVLMSSPIGRMSANPTSPSHIQLLAAWHSQPGGAREKLGRLLNEASVEAVKNYGLSPATALRRYDRYLSRAFTDQIAGQVKLSDYINQMEAEARLVTKLTKQVSSGRFRRKMTEEQSNQRFIELVNKGDISLHDALAGGVVATMVMNNHLNNISEIHDFLESKGLLSDTKKPNTYRVGTDEAAPEGKNASPDPYNYAFGKLAGKYVDRELATQLGIAPRAVRKAIETIPFIRAVNDLLGEVAGFTRFMKTTGNVIVYPTRNAINDPTVVMAASGESPYSGWGRKANLEVTADIDRMARTRQDPNGVIVSPLLREMMETGLLSVDKLPNDSSVPTNLRPQVQAMVKKGEKIIEQATDPAERIKALAHAGMYIRAMGSAGFKEMPLTAYKAFKESLAEYKEAKKNGMTRANRMMRAPSEFLAHVNEHLGELALSQIMAKMEMKRMAWSYKVAREKLNLDKDRAAIFVRDTVYGVDKPSELVSRISQSPWATLFVAPLFLNYGIWQGKRTLQRSLANPDLWISHMINQGITAMNEDDLLREPFLENNWRDRISRIHVQHVAAPEIGLGSIGGVQEAMRFAGVPETVVAKVGKPDNVIAQDLTNLIGGQTFIHQYKPDREGIAFATQFGVYGGLLAQLKDPRMRDPDYREQTGLMGGESKTLLPGARELIKAMVYRTFPSSWITPVNPNDPRSFPVPLPFLGRAGGVVSKVGQAKYEGRPAYKNVYGEEINMLDMASREFGSFAPNIIDNTSFQTRLAKRLNAQRNEIQQELRDQMRTQASMNLPEEEQAARKAEFATAAANRIGQTATAYTWQNQYKSRDEALKASKQAAADYVKRMRQIREQEGK